MENRKVVVIGDGAVGSTTAYTLALGETVNEIVIIDVNKAKAEGDVLDILHGMPFVTPKIIKAGDYSDCKDAHIIIITAGVAQKEGETRQDLLFRNIRVFDSIITSLKPYVDDDTIILVVTNPVDVLSFYLYKKLGLKAKHVIGSGTVLDTARLKAVISEDTKIDPRNIHTFVLGEHGDSEVAAFSVTTVGGLNLTEYCHKCGRCKDHGMQKLSELHTTVKNAAYEIISKKGATFYAVALAVNRIVDTILNNQNSVLTVSTYLENEFDGKVKDIYMSLPTVVNSDGVDRILRPNYSSEEKTALIKSAAVLHEKIASLNIK
jgi:L-lactate dehydrogenase